MKNTFTILGCGSSLGSPWITNYSANLKKNVKNVRTRCCAHIQKGDLSILIDTSPDIKKQFGVKAGLSDHTMGIEGPIVATALGATVIEKHFILDKSIGGPDSHFSLDEKEFTEMVRAVRIAEQMMGLVDYEMTEKKMKSRQFSRSLFIVENVKAGDKITNENIRSIRPGFGIHPKYLSKIIGKEFCQNIKKGTPMSFKFLKDN